MELFFKCVYVCICFDVQNEYSNRRTSCHLIDLINYFGESGGFDTLLQVISAPDRKNITLHIVHQFCRIALNIAKLLKPQFSDTFWPRVQFALLSRVENLFDGDIQTQERDRFSEIIDDASAIALQSDTFAKIGPPFYCRRVDDDDDDGSGLMGNDHSELATRFVDYFRLTLSYRLIRCPFLSKQLLGISQIIEIADDVEKASRSVRSYRDARSYKRSAPMHYITKDILVKWFHAKKFFDVLLVQGFHHEVLKRTSRLLQFLAVSEALDPEHVKKLWLCGIGKHEVIVRAVYDSIAELSKYMDAKHFDVLFSHIEMIDLSDYNEYLLLFVKNVTENALQAVQGLPSHWYGLDIMWRLILDESPASLSVASKAYECFCAILKRDDYRPRVKFYIEKCIENVLAGHSAPQSLRLCVDLINSICPDTYVRCMHCCFIA